MSRLYGGIFLVLCALILPAGAVWSQAPSPEPIVTMKPTDPSVASGDDARGFIEPEEDLIEEEESGFIYESPNIQKISQLYWALDRLDPNNDENVDNYMMINECDIYSDYYQHEFEWKKVREATRQYLIDNKKNFPRRFQFVQPLKLGAYDLETQTFEVAKKFQISPTRRFEVIATKSTPDICGWSKPIVGYPQNMIIELSRPFSLTTFHMPLEEADAYISAKLEKFRGLRKHLQVQKNVYDMRDAYLVMKIKMFASKGDIKLQDGLYAGLMGVMESVEIYSDIALKDRIYYENFRKRKKQTDVELKMLKELENRRDLLHTTEELEKKNAGPAIDPKALNPLP